MFNFEEAKSELSDYNFTGDKFDILNPPTYTKLTTTSPTDLENLYWLIFSYSKGVEAYIINVSLLKIQEYSNRL